MKVDLEYRKEWDDNVVQLDIIEKDDESDSELLRWVTRFPVIMNYVHFSPRVAKN